ncbi:MAG TPA: hypothetical protein VEL10_11885 [Gaiellaceae bacterium]|nr:hypothetical protein [Gaiellaceae bacterium]
MRVLGSRFGPLVVAFSVVATATAPTARSALFFLFSPTNAHPGEKVVVRTGGTPQGFRLGDRVRGSQQPIRLLRVETGGSRSAWPIAVGWAAAIFVVVIGAAIFLGRRRLLAQRRTLMRGPLSSDT